MAKKETLKKGQSEAKEKPLVPNWTPKNALLVGVMASLLTVGGGYFFVVQPALAEKAAQQEALESATSSLQMANDTLKVAQNYEAKYPIVRDQYDTLLSQFPNTAAIDDLNTQIEGLAGRNGVSVRSLTTQIPVLLTPQSAPVEVQPTDETAETTETTDSSADSSGIAPVPLPDAPASTLARVDVSLVVEGSREGIIGFTKDLNLVDRSLIVSTTVLMEEGDEYSMNISGISYLYAPLEDPIEQQQEVQKKAEAAQGQNEGDAPALQENQPNN